MSYQLTIEPLGHTIEVEEGQTILDASLRAGIYLPHACCHGLCATCKVQVADGEVEHGEASTFALMDFEREEGKCLACCATLQSDTVIEAEIEEDPDAEDLPVEDFSGEVVRLEDLTPTVKGIWLKLDRPLRFQAGQYVNLEVPLADGRARAFSLANSPDQPDLVELNVRIVPGGQVTTWLHGNLRVGDRLTLSGPYGRFFVRKSAAVPLVFMAGGSGLSSPKAMIDDLLAEGSDLPITLVYGQRTRGELYYHDYFEDLAARHPNFSYVPVLSHEPDDSAWRGARGFVHDAAKAHFDNDFRGHKAYLCGPPAMIEACITTLMQGRLFERDIYMEKFFSAADASQQLKSPLFKSI
ncbi:MAG: phenol 2-monooxygenase subunit [Rhodocyclaceae bacterium]|nr:phenol 2-monooxygenase subunit [Rhodocyclaceae bacterium]